jgi:hypothetical protein
MQMCREFSANWKNCNLTKILVKIEFRACTAPSGRRAMRFLAAFSGLFPAPAHSERQPTIYHIGQFAPPRPAVRAGATCRAVRAGAALKVR